MYKIFICDDEPKMLSDISEKVKKALPEAVVCEFAGGDELLGALMHNACDILLLDIDMPGISGLDVASRISSLSDKPLLVFVTCHDELVYDSLQYHPFGFVRKSYLDNELANILADCAVELDSREKHFCFHAANAEIKLPLDEIMYFESEGNYLRLFCAGREFRLRETLCAVENALSSSGFVRVHKAFLVNQIYVRRLAGDELELSDGARIPIGRSYAEKAKSQLMRYMLR